MKLNDKNYNVNKWIAQLLLPAIATLYLALSGIWGLPYGEQIAATITAVDTFIGSILGAYLTDMEQRNHLQMYLIEWTGISMT